MPGIKLLFATIALFLSLRFTCEFKRAMKLNTKRFSLNTAFNSNPNQGRKRQLLAENAGFPDLLVLAYCFELKC